MGYSVAIKMDNKYIKSNGEARVYMLVTINRKKKEFKLNLTWPVDKFNKKTGECLPKNFTDKDFSVYNVAIGNARTRANEIIKEYLLKDIPLTIEKFVTEYNSDFNKKSFIDFYAKTMHKRYRNNQIADNTLKAHKMTLNKLRAFKDDILFTDLTNTWGEEFDMFMVDKYGINMNSRWGNHKNVKTYLHKATIENIEFIDPYHYFTAKMSRSNYQALTRDEFRQLYAYYCSQEITHSHKVNLRRFLFGCLTGLRISDLKRLNVDKFKDGKMSLSIFKLRKYQRELSEVPLSDLANELLEDEIKFNDSKLLFNNYTEQFSNRILKEIAAHLEIDKRLHHHVGRVTFASFYNASGGNIRRLMEYMGLSKISTVEKYLRVDKEGMQEDIDKLNEMF